MKLATKGVVTSLALVSLLIGVPASAQQWGPDQQEGLAAQQQPQALIGAPAGESPLAVPGGDEPYDQGPLVYPGDGIFGAASVGTCCEVCGGGYSCPPNWYFNSGTRVMSRSKSRSIEISSEFGNQIGFSPIKEDDSAEGDPDNSQYTLNNVREVSPVLGARSLGFDIAAGAAVTVGRYFWRDTHNRDCFLEFRYWGLNSWWESKTVNGQQRQPKYNEQRYDSGLPGFRPYTRDELLRVLAGDLNAIVDEYTGSLFSPFRQVTTSGNTRTLEQLLSGAFNNVDQHSIFYRSTMHNYEMNRRVRPRGRPDRLVLHPNGRWRRECQPGQYWSYLFGVRVMSIKEQFGFSGSGVRSVPIYDANYENIEEIRFTNQYSGEYFIRTHNDLLGFQVGMDMIYRRCKWQWGVAAKVGPFLNFADQVTQQNLYEAELAYNAQTQTYSVANEWSLSPRRVAQECGASLVGEVNIVGSYRIRPNLSLNASYDFLWVTGLALAPEQLVFKTDPPPRVNTNGRLYCQGLTLGLEFLW